MNDVFCMNEAYGSKNVNESTYGKKQPLPLDNKKFLILPVALIS